MRLAIIVTALLALAGCVSGEVVSDPGGGASTIGSSQHSLTTMQAARSTILATRPKASQLMVTQLNLTLARNGIVDAVVRDVEDLVDRSLTDGTAITACPYLAPHSGDTSVSCRLLVDRALQDALLESGPLEASVEQDIQLRHGATLAADDLDFVRGWGREAISSGIDVGAVHAMRILRQQGACDQAPDPLGAAVNLGLQQGQALFEATEQTLLPTIPRYQCDTDVIASTILSEAQAATDGFARDHPVCQGYAATDLLQTVDLSRAETSRGEGLTEGLRQAYEAARVRLVDTWQCVDCLCVSGNGGGRPTICFGQSLLKSKPGAHYPTILDDVANHWSDSLAALAASGEPQCQPQACRDAMDQSVRAGLCLDVVDKFGTDVYKDLVNYCQGDLMTDTSVQAQNIRGQLESSCSVWVPPVVVGSPLVVDLDGDGIQLSPRRVSFDLAATGEPALIPTLLGADAFLALDLDGNGRIDSGAELFGNATSCGAQRCADGMAALAQHDANRDGVIDERDPIFERLLLWRDANRDGQSSAEELMPLSAVGLREIALATRSGAGLVAGPGSALRAASYSWADGTAGLVADVWFQLEFDRRPRDPRTTGTVSTLAARHLSR
jgi:hypothetical protein